MTTKYTPGPWKAYNAIGGRILNRWHIKGSNHNSLTSVHAQDSSEEEAANALLIAAAPALAEALRQALETLQSIASEEGDVAFWNDGGEGRKACNSARHALQNAGLVPDPTRPNKTPTAAV